MITIASLASSGWHDGRGWDGPPGPAFLVLPLLVVTLVVVAVIAYRGRRASGAVAIVGERYARGEIDEEEYRRRLTELRGKRR